MSGTMSSLLYKNILMCLALALLALFFLSMLCGPQGFSLAIFKNNYLPELLDYRATRALLAVIAGSSLAASGASLQALFRNPLADPHLFGISGGAAVGACAVIAFGGHTSFAPSIGAVLGGLLSFVLIFSYLNKIHHSSLSHCLLVGVLINSLAAALITLLKTVLPPIKTQSLLYWLVGHISTVERFHLYFIIPAWLIGLALLIRFRGELELLSFGGIETSILGINTKSVIRVVIFANCLLIGTVVTFAGMIGFLGLVVPHFIRLLIHADQRFVLPTATLVGALLLLFFDILSRLSFMLWQSEIPVGALSALILSPVFFFLLLRDRHDAQT